MAKRGKSCCYCKRRLEAPTSPSRLAYTRDHVKPRAAGGTKTVPCCRQCNQLKGNLHPSVWRWFTINYPGWWKTFDTPAEVATVCRDISYKMFFRADAPRQQMEVRNG